MPDDASACRAASQPRSEVTWSLLAYRRSRIVVIASNWARISLFGLSIFFRSGPRNSWRRKWSFGTTCGGMWLPVPTITERMERMIIEALQPFARTSVDNGLRWTRNVLENGFIG